MKTSNFRISGKNPNAVAISRGIPSWYKGKRLIELAPSRELMKVKDPGEYTWRYQSEVLSVLDAQEIKAKLDDNSILLCWEKPGEDCHRRLVAEWLEQELGIEVPELGQSKVRAVQPQMELGE